MDFKITGQKHRKGGWPGRGGGGGGGWGGGGVGGGGRAAGGGGLRGVVERTESIGIH